MKKGGVGLNEQLFDEVYGIQAVAWDLNSSPCTVAEHVGFPIPLLTYYQEIVEGK